MKFLSFARIVGFGLVLSAIAGQSSSSFEQIIRQTGQFVSGMESYDRIISQLMHEHGIPGAAVGVVRHGRLVYARGFGMADREAGIPVEPDALFRVASLSKPITAVAVLKLVEDGDLDLDARVFRDVLPMFEHHPAADGRMNQITVRDLLRHSGGFDRDISWDPMFMQNEISREIGKRTPLNCEDVITYMKSRPLDFPPGKRASYSNFGYCVLGRVIERVSGLSYEDYVRQAVLIPSKARHMRIADPFLSGKLRNEVRYYDYPGAGLTRSLDSEANSSVTWPYNGFLSVMDSHGGWASSVVDLLRFVVAVDGRGRDDIIANDFIKLMIDRPPYERGAVWYGLGWLVRDLGGGETNWWHSGSIPGASSFLVRAGNGTSWAVVANSRPENWGDFGYALDVALWDAFDQVTTWPGHDLFPQFR